MILAQPLYPRRDGGNIEGRPRRVSCASLSSLFVKARIFRAQPALDADAQVKDEHSQDDQPECRRIEHKAPRTNKCPAKNWVGLI